ncbi:MAG: hypothetical protein AB1467_04610 [Candidatus Diapherotrites archaeon]
MGLLEGIISFFKRIFSPKPKAKEAGKEEIEFSSPSELLSFIEARVSKEKEELEKNSLIKFSEVKHYVKELRLSLDELKATDIKIEEGDPKLRRIVATSKETLLQHLNSLIKKLEPPSSREYDALKNYCLNSSSLLESEINSLGKSIAYTSFILKEPMKKLGLKIKELNSIFVDLRKLFEEKKGLSFLPQLKSRLAEIQKKLFELKELQKAVKIEEKNLASLEKKLKESTGGLISLKNSPEALECNRVLEEIDELERKKNDLKEKLLELFAPIDKPLKRLSQLIESGQFPAGPEETQVLTALSSDPFTALKRDPKALHIKKILSYLKELIEKETISLKEKEKDKKLESIEGLLSLNFFDKFFWEFNSIEVKFSELEKGLRKHFITSKILEIEKTIEGIERSLHEKKEELSELAQGIERNTDEVQLLENSISSSASSISGQKIIFSLQKKGAENE